MLDFDCLRKFRFLKIIQIPPKNQPTIKLWYLVSVVVLYVDIKEMNLSISSHQLAIRVEDWASVINVVIVVDLQNGASDNPGACLLSDGPQEPDGGLVLDRACEVFSVLFESVLLIRRVEELWQGDQLGSFLGC